MACATAREKLLVAEDSTSTGAEGNSFLSGRASKAVVSCSCTAAVSNEHAEVTKSCGGMRWDSGGCASSMRVVYSSTLVPLLANVTLVTTSPVPSTTTTSETHFFVLAGTTSFGLPLSIPFARLPSCRMQSCTSTSVRRYSSANSGRLPTGSAFQNSFTAALWTATPCVASAIHSSAISCLQLSTGVYFSCDLELAMFCRCIQPRSHFELPANAVLFASSAM
mmetsp:Transcript_17351/g.67459  ORF Transcript_17351/g.67459 Transcript_17351/m.67459 type:complete len:222 (-) Transcript_17351:440-1105(-)